MEWGVHMQGLGYGGKIGSIQQYIRGKTDHHNGEGIGVMEGISEGAGEPTMGL